MTTLPRLGLLTTLALLPACKAADSGQVETHNGAASSTQGLASMSAAPAREATPPTSTFATPHLDLSSPAAAAASSATDLPTAAQDPKAAVARWNDAHRSANLSGFESLYADSVLFYGRQQRKAECIAAKRQFLTAHPDFAQELVSGPESQLTGNTLRANFVKRVTLSGKVTHYPSYLVFERFGAEWRIVIEGDDTTDATLKKRLEARKQHGSVVEGDWDGDGTRETVRLVPPKFPAAGPDDFGECEGPCNCTLTFEKHPPIVVENCIGGVPVNEGDLNGDKGDELGLLPDWWTSCWHAYRVFGLRKGEWTQAVDPISTHCAQWEDGVDAVAKDPRKPGRVIISTMILPDFEVKTFSVPVR